MRQNNVWQWLAQSANRRNAPVPQLLVELLDYLERIGVNSELRTVILAAAE